ncbi:SAM-dependent methyltransferase [Streptomyces thinghirensis]|nr:SAM-dependent methyltransferase [Streptomyces thinghirensis]
MFSPEGPTLRELAVQVLSSVERGYDLLAPKFEHTLYRTPDRVLDAVASAPGADGAVRRRTRPVLRYRRGSGRTGPVCRERVTGVDFSAGHAGGRAGARRARGAGGLLRGRGRPAPCRSVPSSTSWSVSVRSDTSRPVNCRACSPRCAPYCARAAASPPRGRAAPPRLPRYWTLLGFDAVMRARNAPWRPPFVMYYRTFRLGDVGRELARAGFRTDLHALPGVRAPARRQSASPDGRGPAPALDGGRGRVSRPPAG